MQMDLMQSLQRYTKVVKSRDSVRYSNKCHAAWAKFVLDQPAPAVSGGVYAYAVVNKYKNGVFQNQSLPIKEMAQLKLVKRVLIQEWYLI